MPCPCKQQHDGGRQKTKSRTQSKRRSKRRHRTSSRKYPKLPQTACFRGFMADEMRAYKNGQLYSKSGTKVKNYKQAVAIAISVARRKCKSRSRKSSQRRRRH